MRILNEINLLDNVSAIKISDYITNPNLGTTIYVQISSSTGATFSLTAEGTMEQSSEAYETLNYFKINDYSTGRPMASDGIYCFSASAVSKFRLNLSDITGSLTARVRLVEE